MLHYYYVCERSLYLHVVYYFGIIFFIEGIMMTVYGVKKKNGMLTYIGIVFSIMTFGVVMIKLTGH
jgi:hypothetical protein